MSFAPLTDCHASVHMAGKQAVVLWEVIMRVIIHSHISLGANSSPALLRLWSQLCFIQIVCDLINVICYKSNICMVTVCAQSNMGFV